MLRLLAGGLLAGVRFEPPSERRVAAQGGTERAPGDETAMAGIRLCWCPAGRFLMGSPAAETGHRPDEGQVHVQLTRGFWMGKFEITQAQWSAIAGAFPDRPPSAAFGIGADVPVYWVSYEDATQLCERATDAGSADRSLPRGWRFSLPTEAQWEYACRAGTTTATSFGDRLGGGQANFSGAPLNGGARGPAHGRSVRVGSYPPNAWGLCDMHGNVFEWCRDWYHARLPGGVDPDLSTVKGTPNRDGTHSRVRRGGAWNDDGQFCRSALRLRYEPHRRSDHIGFRVAVVSD
jgi:formylglycine-generating enzyme required for sulfatase activity